MAYSRFRIALKDIIRFFDEKTQKVYSPNNLTVILEENRNFWRLTQSMTTKAFIQDLIKYTKFEEVVVTFPESTILRYAYGPIEKYSLAQSLKPNAYLTHYSSLVLHELTEQDPKIVYVTHEQTSKNTMPEKLIQKNVDIAFSRSQRITKNIATINNFSIALLNGKQTNNIGVEKHTATGLLFTGLERTLIDCTVRPVYAGGPGEVLKAFANAQSRISINKLMAILSKMEFIYPYHQAIGFYLEKAGNYKPSQINLVEKYPINIDFYLTYDMKEMDYSNKWRIYYPKGF